MVNLFDGDHLGDTSAAAFNADIGAWNVSGVETMDSVFYKAAAFNRDLNAWDVSRVTIMNELFMSSSAFNGDVSAWDVSSVVSMAHVFYEAAAFNGDVSAWSVGKVESMYQMFDDATAFNGDVTRWDVKSVSSFYEMFCFAAAFNGDVSSWSVAATANTESMFLGATAFRGDVSRWAGAATTEGAYEDAAEELRHHENSDHLWGMTSADHVLGEADGDGDGAVSLDEFEALCRNTLFLKLSGAEVAAGFGAVDADEDGRLSRAELEATIAAASQRIAARRVAVAVRGTESEADVRRPSRLVALVAHNNMKPAMMAFVAKHQSFFKTVQITTTGSTGAALEKKLGLQIARKVA